MEKQSPCSNVQIVNHFHKVRIQIFRAYSAFKNFYTIVFMKKKLMKINGKKREGKDFWRCLPPRRQKNVRRLPKNVWPRKDER